MIKSPKERFQESQVAREAWAQMVYNPIFDEACDAALLQMQSTMSGDQEVSAASHQQMVGAQRLLYILKTLHETTKETTQPTSKGLNYQAGV